MKKINPIERMIKEEEEEVDKLRKIDFPKLKFPSSQKKFEKTSLINKLDINDKEKKCIEINLEEAEDEIKEKSIKEFENPPQIIYDKYSRLKSNLNPKYEEHLVKINKEELEKIGTHKIFSQRKQNNNPRRQLDAIEEERSFPLKSGMHSENQKVFGKNLHSKNLINEEFLPQFEVGKNE